MYLERLKDLAQRSEDIILKKKGKKTQGSTMGAGISSSKRDISILSNLVNSRLARWKIYSIVSISGLIVAIFFIIVFILKSSISTTL